MHDNRALHALGSVALRKGLGGRAGGATLRENAITDLTNTHSHAGLQGSQCQAYIHHVLASQLCDPERSSSRYPCTIHWHPCAAFAHTHPFHAVDRTPRPVNTLIIHTYLAGAPSSKALQLHAACGCCCERHYSLFAHGALLVLQACITATVASDNHCVVGDGCKGTGQTAVYCNPLRLLGLSAPPTEIVVKLQSNSVLNYCCRCVPFWGHDCCSLQLIKRNYAAVLHGPSMPGGWWRQTAAGISSQLGPMAPS